MRWGREKFKVLFYLSENLYLIKKMTTTQLILDQLKEVRRQTLRIWAALPEDKYFWRPDPEAMHMLEVIRHVLKADPWFHFIIEKRGDIDLSLIHISEPTRPY